MISNKNSRTNIPSKIYMTELFQSLKENNAGKEGGLVSLKSRPGHALQRCDRANCKHEPFANMTWCL